jgi:tRNA pseudouridine65 synthase
MNLSIVYQDKDLIAIHKPAGLMVHRSAMDAAETRSAVQQLRAQTGVHVLPVHRLDRATSGLLLFACHREAASALSAQFAAHSIRKSYLAIVRGYAPDEAHIDHPVKAQADKHSPAIWPRGITDLHTLARCELPIANDRYPSSRYSLVQLMPQTGKRHQLRYHMKHLSHPIIGDPKYGKSLHNTLFKTHFGAERLLLAATGLRCVHPMTQQPLQLVCPPSEDFVAVARQLGWAEALAAHGLALQAG